MRISLLATALFGLLPAGSAFAVPHLDPHGVGQVLLMPYYTVEHGQSTLISITNANAHAAYLHITMREGMSGQETLDFNVALAAHDTFTGAIFTLGNTGGAAFVTDDKSCTNPQIAGNTQLPALPDGRRYVNFRNSQFLDGGPTALTRTREGFIDVIELGMFPDELGQQIAARDCSSLTSLRPDALTANEGGLYGSAAVVNALAGTYFSEPVTAVADFARVSLISPSGDFPNLALIGASAQGAGPVAVSVPVGNDIQTLHYALTSAIDAFSALIATESVLGDFVVDPLAGATTEWVITQPTKRFYTTGAGAPMAPYTERFGAARPMSCSPYTPAIWNREQVPTTPARSIPAPTGTQRPDFALCYTVDVVQFGTSEAPTSLLGSNLGSSLAGFAPATTAGAARLLLGQDSLQPATAGSTLRPDLDGKVLRGLPVIGFQVVNYVNGNVTPGVLANYAAASDLHTTPGYTAP